MSDSTNTGQDNSEQIGAWNGDQGQKWATNTAKLDILLAPFLDPVLACADLKPGLNIIDIGCGTGTLAFAAAENAAPGGRVTGVDVSAPLLEIAQTRAAGNDAVTFIEADAAAFQADTPFDTAISRFGVMFFAEPAPAFANIRSNIRPGGRLTFVCWQGLKDNEWVHLTLETALPFFKTPPVPPEPTAPGPFAFADADRVRNILKSAGWSNIAIEPWAGDLQMPGANLEDAAEFMITLGPIAHLLLDQEVDLGPVTKALEQRLADKAGATGQVSLAANAWLVTATA